MERTKKTGIRIGDDVEVHLGPTTWRARVVEDRGPIGMRGRQLFRVQLLDDQADTPQFVEVPVENIEASRN